MKKLVLAVLLLVGTAAYADTLTFTGSTANGIYGPYSMILNTGPVTPMICFSENNYITSGESWSVQALNITQIGTWTGSFAGSTTQYNELGYLADQLFADPGNSTLQQDIWGVLNNSFTINVPSGYVTSDIFYIPVGDFSGYTYGTPQPFISHVPEPSSLVLLGAGLLGLLGLSLKKANA